MRDPTWVYIAREGERHTKKKCQKERVGKVIELVLLCSVRSSARAGHFGCSPGLVVDPLVGAAAADEGAAQATQLTAGDAGASQKVETCFLCVIIWAGSAAGCG